MSIRYNVVFAEFAERHFIKSFKKKYKNAWESTLIALRFEFGNFDLLLQRVLRKKLPIKHCLLVFGKQSLKSQELMCLAMRLETAVL